MVFKYLPKLIILSTYLKFTNCIFLFQESSQNRRLKKYENDDIPQEKVVRIYQDELAKIMTRRVDDMRHNREGFPG